jgi:hypothetical protein
MSDNMIINAFGQKPLFITIFRDQYLAFYAKLNPIAQYVHYLNLYAL